MISLVLTREHIPNLLSSYRILGSGLLLCLALNNLPTAFLVLLLSLWLSDVLDGYLARAWDCETELGAQLDTIGDGLTFLVLPFGLLTLWHELVSGELPFVLLGLSSLLLPALAGLLKFRRLPSYHTWATKAAATVVSVSVLVLILFGQPAMFRVAILFHAAVAVESLLVTLVLTRWTCNVPSLLHAMRISTSGGTGPPEALRTQADVRASGEGPGTK